jgi:hypothetical protein
MAAVAAKLGLWEISSTASRTDKMQPGAALPAEIHPRWILELTIQALHSCPRQTMERGRPLENFQAPKEYNVIESVVAVVPTLLTFTLH